MENKEEITLHQNTRKLWELPESVVDVMQSIAIAIVLSLFTFVVIAMPNEVQGNSMEPNFHPGEIIVTNKLPTWLGETGVGKTLGLNYSRGDIIVFRKPGNSDFIKRLIGLPGDTVAIKDGAVYINGEKLDESEYLNSSVYTEGGTFIRSGGVAKQIPEGKYFMLGDNRGNSHDSRAIDIGFVEKEWIKGKVELRYWPTVTIFSNPDYNL